MSNTPNTSRNSFNYSKFYDSLVLQQGVPVLDSDQNEQSNITLMREMMDRRAELGDVALLPKYPGAERGFEPKGVSSNIHDLEFSAGYASIYGSVIPTTRTPVPETIRYTSQDNYMTAGIVTAAPGDNTISDIDSKFIADLDLVGCYIFFTTGAAVGGPCQITEVVNETTLKSAYIPTSVVVGDKYIITPSEIQLAEEGLQDLALWVWWETINEVKDPTIVNPGVGVETSERLIKRWCIRAVPLGAPIVNPWELSIRKATIGTVYRPTGSTELTVEMKENVFVDPILASNKVFPIKKKLEYSGSHTQYVLPYDKYYLGFGTDADSARMFVDLCTVLNTTAPVNKAYIPLTKDNHEILDFKLFSTSTVEITNPSIVVDAFGYFTGELIIKLGSVITANVVAFISVGRTLESIKKDEVFPAENIIKGTSSINVVKKDKIKTLDTIFGTEASFIQGHVSGWLDNVVESLHKKIDTYPSSGAIASGNWYELYQTGNHSNTQTVTKVYWNAAGEKLEIRGGTLSNQDRKITATNSYLTIKGSWKTSAGAFLEVSATQTAATPGDLFDPENKSDWVNYDASNSVEHTRVTSGYGIEHSESHTFNSYVSLANYLYLKSGFHMIWDKRPVHTEGSNGRLLLYTSKGDGSIDGTVNIYITKDQVTGYLKFEIALGCSWDGSNWSYFIANGTALSTASVLSMSSFDGFTYKYKSKQLEPSATSWGDNDWSSIKSMQSSGNHGIMNDRSSGFIEDTFHFTFDKTNYGSTTDASSLYSFVPYDSGATLASAASSSSVTISHTKNNLYSAWVDSINIDGITLKCGGVGQTIPSGEHGYATGSGIIRTIK